MSAALAVGRMLARRPSLAPPNTITEKIRSLGEEERALMSNHLAELDAELQSRLVQKVDAFLQRSTISNDRGILNRVLSFCRVPKGEQRDRLVWTLALQPSGHLSCICADGSVGSLQMCAVS